MKRLLLAVMLTAAIITQPGCKTNNAVTVAYKSEGVVIHSVDTAMNIWHDWVVAGRATQEQVDAVKDAYETYYNAQQVAKAALELYIVNKTPSADSSVVAANLAVANAKDAVIALVQKYAFGSGQGKE